MAFPRPAQQAMPSLADRSGMAVQAFRRLEDLGRIRLSRTFFLRDFLFSEIASAFGLTNLPDNPDLAVETGRRLCEELLEPLQASFGRLCIRSGYRSTSLNDFGHARRLGCASSAKNYGRHIWDRRDANGDAGAMACVVMPWLADHYRISGHWHPMAAWIEANLPYSEVVFFPRLAAFNIGWNEVPKRSIYSHAPPKRGASSLGRVRPAR